MINDASFNCVYPVPNDAARFKLTKAQVQVGDTVKVLSNEIGTDILYLVIDDNNLNSEAGYQIYENDCIGLDYDDEKCTKLPNMRDLNTPGHDIRVRESDGLYITYDILHIARATEKDIAEGTNRYKPIVPSNVKAVFSQYGITDKSTMADIVSRLDVLEAGGSSGGTGPTQGSVVFANYYEFPNVGNDDTLYIATDENTMYYWDSKSQIYVKIIDITKYYTSEETDSAIGNAVASLGNVITVKGVKSTEGELPTDGNNAGDLWFVGTDGETTDSFSEYVWTSAGAWEFLGRVQTEVDLSDYATITYVDGKVTTINGHLTDLKTDSHTHANATVLNATTASYTTAEKTKLAGIAEGANKTVVDAALSATSTNPVQNKAVNTALNTKVDKVDGKGLSTNDFTTAEKTKLDGVEAGANKTIVDSVLDAESTNPVQNKVINNALSDKVDKVDGKGLSTEDYTTTEKTKLAGIETGANKTIVDSELNISSTNPIQNSIVATEIKSLNSKVGVSTQAITSAEFEAIITKDENTLYIIKEASS